MFAGTIRAIARPSSFAFISALVVTALVRLCTAADAFAQAVILTAPTSEITVAEGDDFATNVLGNPWDMEEKRDIAFEENFFGTSVTAAQGIWSAINQSTGGYFFPLFGGFTGSLSTSAPDGDRDLPRYGSDRPLNAAKYSVLSYRMRSSSRGTYAIYWAGTGGPTNFPDGTQYGANFDGVYLDRAYTNAGFMTYVFDLRSPGFDSRSGSWGGNIATVRFDPSVQAPAGASTELDWIRLVDPASAPRARVSWNLLGIPAGALVTVWIDPTSGGYDGTVFARYIAGGRGRAPTGGEYSTNASPPSETGYHDFPSAILPPGRHYFYVTAQIPVGGVLTEIARSGYSAALRVTAAPSAVFRSPSEISGTDYAEANLGNAWDMSDVSDVANLPGSGFPADLMQFSNSGFLNGVFQATTNLPLPGNSQSDAQVHLPISQPIDTSRYRYLSYRLAADDSLFPTIQQKVAEGWVTRPVFWNSNLFVDGGSLKAHPLYEGFHTYVIDLWDASTVESGLAWRSIPFVRRLRIDPLETAVPTWFFLDSVKLTAENAPTGGSFNIRFDISDQDSSAVQASLYLDIDRSGFNGSLIASLGSLPPGSHSFTLSTSGLASGRYYPYIVLNDGNNVRQQYAAVPIVIGGPAAPDAARVKMPFDYDGDGTSDPIIFRRLKKSLFYVRSTNGASYTRSIGGLSSQPVHGDYDGDGVADLTVAEHTKSGLLWSSLLSSTGGIESRYWGYASDLAFMGDFDGDGLDEYSIYRGGAWYTLERTGAVNVGQWGEPGDVPVAADFDGDHRDDFAIWRPRDGMWWILYSGGGTRVTQWGLPGDIPVPGDFDNDGRADFAVWRPGVGTWFVMGSATGAQEVMQWGLPGDLPIVGDFSGDGRLDFTVWRPSSGQWFINDRSGSANSAQWGLPSDALPTQ